MANQMNKTTLQQIAGKMMKDLFFRSGKENEGGYKIAAAGGVLTTAFVTVSIMLSVVLPKSLFAQSTNNMNSTTCCENQGLIYAMMGPSNSLAVFDLVSKEIIDSVAVPGNPHGGAITPDRNYIYAASMGSNWVSVVDTRSQEVVKKIDVGSISHHAMVRPDGQYVYVAAEQIVVINTATNKIAKRIETPESPYYPVFAPDGRRLYVLNMGKTISVIDTKTQKLINTIDMGATSMMGHLAISSDGKTLYTTNDKANQLSVIDAGSGQLRAAVPVGKQPHGVAVSADDSRVFVSNRGESKISVIDTETEKVTANLLLEGNPGHLSMTADGDYLLVALNNRSQKNKSQKNDSKDRTSALTIIDSNTLKIFEEIPAWPQVHTILVPQNK